MGTTFKCVSMFRKFMRLHIFDLFVYVTVLLFNASLRRISKCGVFISIRCIFLQETTIGSGLKTCSKPLGIGGIFFIFVFHTALEPLKKKKKRKSTKQLVKT